MDSLYKQHGFVAGVDEVGRGPLAGNVVAAAVILDWDNPIEGLADSKKLTEKKRDELFDLIFEKAKAVSIGQASPEEIDRINILQASLLAMSRAVDRLSVQPDFALVDGNKLPQLSMPAEAIIKGDQKVQAIAAASIIAKVTRDRQMLEADALYPEYGFKQHKGYPTKLHMNALSEHGPTPIHRQSFKPVAQFCVESRLSSL